MATVTRSTTAKLEELLGKDASNLLEHKCETVPKSQLHLPGPDFVSRVWKDSDRSIQVLRNLRPSSITAASQAPATFRSFPSTRASSTPPAHRSRPTRSTSTAR